VARADAVGVGASRNVEQESVSDLAGHFFNAASGGFGFCPHIDCGYSDIESEAAGKTADEIGVFARFFAAQEVIEVRDVKRSRKLLCLANAEEHIEQRDRIGPSRHGDDDFARAVKHRVTTDEAAHFFKGCGHFLN
jgi:hypothetical protein